MNNFGLDMQASQILKVATYEQQGSFDWMIFKFDQYSDYY